MLPWIKNIQPSALMNMISRSKGVTGIGLASYILLCLVSSWIVGAEDTKLPDIVIRENMGTSFSKVATLDNGVSFWSHTIAIEMPDFSIHRVPDEFCQHNSTPERKNIMAYMCKTYGHTFAAYDLTQRKVIDRIYDNHPHSFQGYVVKCIIKYHI